MCAETCPPTIPFASLTETVNSTETVAHSELRPQLVADGMSKHVTVMECIRDTETNLM